MVDQAAQLGVNLSAVIADIPKWIHYVHVWQIVQDALEKERHHDENVSKCNRSVQRDGFYPRFGYEISKDKIN